MKLLRNVNTLFFLTFMWTIHTSLSTTTTTAPPTTSTTTAPPTTSTPLINVLVTHPQNNTTMVVTTSSSSSYSPCGFLWITPQALPSMNIQSQGLCNYLYVRDVTTFVLWFLLVILMIIALVNKSLLSEYDKALWTVMFYSDPAESALYVLLLVHIALFVVALLAPELIVIFFLLVLAAYIYMACATPTKAAGSPAASAATTATTTTPIAPVAKSSFNLLPRIQRVTKYKPIPPPPSSA